MCEITPSSGARWTGLFESGPDDFPLTGFFATPSPSHLCAVVNGAGYIVPVLTPGEWESVNVMPVLNIRRVPETPILLAADFQDLCAYGPEGLLWRIERLSLDGLTIDAVTPDAIRGIAHGSDGEKLEFLVEAESGRHEGGWGNAKQLSLAAAQRKGKRSAKRWI